MNTENWTLDPLGNWASIVTDGNEVDRTHNSQNELTQAVNDSTSTTTNLTFDNNGNTLSDDQGITYTYDAWNRQVTASLVSTSPIQMSYTYDGLGRRITSVDGPKSTGTSSSPVVLQINNGEVESAMVDSLTLEFQSTVTLTSSNLTLTNAGSTAMAYNLASSNGGKNWTLSFPSSLSSSYIGNSLPDGAYTLNVTVGSINQTFTFFRLYGDFNGDGVVNAEDFTLMSEVFGQVTNSTDWFLDYNADSVINSEDFTPYSANLGQATTGHYSGPIVWNTVPPRDLYYSSNWQVVEEDTQSLTTGNPETVDQYVWGLAYVDEMVLRDDNASLSSSANYGTSTSGLNERFYVMQDANWNTVALVNDWSDSIVENFIYDPYGNVTVLNAAATGGATDAYIWMYLHQGGGWIR